MFRGASPLPFWICRLADEPLVFSPELAELPLQASAEVAPQAQDVDLDVSIILSSPLFLRLEIFFHLRLFGGTSQERGYAAKEIIFRWRSL